MNTRRKKKKKGYMNRRLICPECKKPKSRFIGVFIPDQCGHKSEPVYSNNKIEESEAVKKYRELGILILENPELSFWEAVKEFSESQ